MSKVVVDQVDGKPIIRSGRIKIGRFFRGQRYTCRGYYFDEVASALQKSIRRGNVEDSLFFGGEMYDMGGPFRSNLMNRMKVIVSEDIGIANPLLPIFSEKILKSYSSETSELSKKNTIMKLIYFLANSPKSRVVDNLIHGVMGDNPSELPKKYLFVPTWNRKTRHYNGEKDDHPDFLRYMNGMKTGLKNKKSIETTYWMKKIWDIPERSKKMKYQSGNSRKSGDYIYAVWQELRREVSPLGRNHPQYHQKVIESLRRMFHEMKNGDRERLFIVHAIMYICNLEWIEEQHKEMNGWFKMKATEFKNLSFDFSVLRKMPDIALDKHTKRGKKLGRGSSHFYDFGCILANVPKRWENDPYAEWAKFMDLAREKEGIPFRSRPKMRKKRKKRKKKRKRMNGEEEEEEEEREEKENDFQSPQKKRKLDDPKMK